MEEARRALGPLPGSSMLYTDSGRDWEQELIMYSSVGCMSAVNNCHRQCLTIEFPDKNKSPTTLRHCELGAE